MWCCQFCIFCAIVGRWCWKWLKEKISGKSFLKISVHLALAQKMSKLLQFSIKVSNISQNILNITCFPILWGRSMDKFHLGNSVKLKLKVKLKQSLKKIFWHQGQIWTLFTQIITNITEANLSWYDDPINVQYHFSSSWQN